MEIEKTPKYKIYTISSILEGFLSRNIHMGFFHFHLHHNMEIEKTPKYKIYTISSILEDFYFRQTHEK
jgi:hypothetical protein